MAALQKKAGGGEAAKPMKWPHDDYIKMVKQVAPVAKQNLTNYKKLRAEMQKFVHPDMDRINPKFDEQLKGYLQAQKKWEYNASRMVTFQESFEKFQKNSPDSVKDVLGAAKKIDGVAKKYSTASDKFVFEMMELEAQFRNLHKDLKAAA
jgi:predicted  nucleic acid-binding Zn-ribbon protein